MNSAATDTGAESEADRPANVVFFDGVCGLCNRSVDFVLSHDRRATIRFAALQGETAQQLRRAEGPVPSKSSAFPSENFDTFVWLDRAGRLFVRSAAVVRVLWALGGKWSFLGWLLWLIPRPLRDVGYRIVAASRYRLFGRRETCRMPTASERARFLP